MGLRASQIKEVTELYLDGKTLSEIAIHLRVSEKDVHSFLPTGRLNVEYQKVAESRLKVKSSTELLANQLQSDADLTINIDQCKIAIQTGQQSIKMLAASLKSARADTKAVEDRLEDVQALIKASPTEKMRKKHATLVKALGKNEDILDKAKKEKAKKDQEAAEAAKRKSDAEQLAEQALIAAAIQAAKEIVSKQSEK